jgi:hypothetical protein
MRGTHVVPVVKLSARPMKTKFGMKHRPAFEILDWKSVNGGRDSSVTTQPRSQLSGPSSIAAEPPTAKPAQPAYAGAQTLAGMTSVKPVTPSEFVDDKGVF